MKTISNALKIAAVSGEFGHKKHSLIDLISIEFLDLCGNEFAALPVFG